MHNRSSVKAVFNNPKISTVTIEKLSIRMKNSNFTILSVGSKPYEKLNAIVTKKSCINDVRNMSSEAQTSCLEGFHSTLNHWHPKVLSYSWMGTYCRYCKHSPNEDY